MLALSVCWLVLLVRLCAAAGASRRARNGRPSVGQGIPFAARMLVARSLSTAPHGRLGGTRTLTLRRGLAVVVCSVVATSTAARAHAYDQSPARTTSPKFVATKPGAAGAADDLAALSASQRKAVDSLGKRAAEHQAKLDAYRADPDAFDNQGLLRNAPSDAVRQRIIDGRIRHLENEIKTFQDQIRKITGGK
jgi:hypothetical protein